jgi:hypothetical protein
LAATAKKLMTIFHWVVHPQQEGVKDEKDDDGNGNDAIPVMEMLLSILLWLQNASIDNGGSCICKKMEMGTGMTVITTMTLMVKDCGESSTSTRFTKTMRNDSNDNESNTNNGVGRL